jgi:hypothetical protein
MIIYKCNSCNNSWENHKPDDWLNIQGSIENNLKNRAIISTGKTELHFCSRKCFDSYFFLYPDIKYFDKETEGFEAGIEKANLSKLDNRRAFIEYFKGKYDIEKLKPLEEDLNYLLDHYFPLEKENSDDDD